MNRYTWWELTLMPGEGWIVRRFTKKGTLFATCVVEYERLTHGEAMDVLDFDSSWFVVQSALSEALGDGAVPEP